MVPRTIYAHWLDPDYLGRIIVPEYCHPTRILQFQTMLKMHAMLGDCVLLSDIQLVESRSLLLCFADPHFRNFIADRFNESFLQLRPRPNHLAGRWINSPIFGGLAAIAKLGA